MIDKVSYSDCVICGSCVNSCPANAISYEFKYLDFKYPKIDADKCIGCNKCEKACPVLGEPAPHDFNFPVAYIARNRDVQIRKRSTSGGIFIEAAKKVLMHGGFACGAVFDEDFHVKHICSNSMEDIYRMMGSKYAQSDMNDCMKSAKAQLDAGKTVLFTGCPCQVAGFRAFLGKPYKNLILMELVCHGIPSDTMLQSYISFRESKHKSKVKSMEFRNKELGWHNGAVKIKFTNGKDYLKPTTADAFINGFHGGIYLKESCFCCQFRSFKSGCDLIIGDFWGAEVELPNMDDNTGLSAVVINSSKGKKFFEALNLEAIPFSVEQVIKYNQNIVASVQKNKNREPFYSYAQEHGYQAAINKFLEEKTVAKMKRKARFALRCAYYRLTGRGKPIY